MNINPNTTKQLHTEHNQQHQTNRAQLTANDEADIGMGY